jgi:hypothetical protein
MVQGKYIGYDKVVKDSLVENRGKKVPITKEEKVSALEQRLEKEKLTHAAINAIRKQLRQLRSE